MPRRIDVRLVQRPARPHPVRTRKAAGGRDGEKQRARVWRAPIHENGFPRCRRSSDGGVERDSLKEPQGRGVARTGARAPRRFRGTLSMPFQKVTNVIGIAACLRAPL
jgi:hypothetical protein